VWWLWNPRQRGLQTREGKFQATDLTRYSSLARIEPKTWQLDTDVPAQIYEPTAITRLFRTPPAYLFEPHSLAKLAPGSLKTPHRSGYGWTVWLQEIINRRDGEIQELEAELRALFPYFNSVTLQRYKDELKQLSHPFLDPKPIKLGVIFKLASGRPVPAENASSGLLLALAHFSLAHATQESTLLLLLEEPENGLNARITLEMMRGFLGAVRRRKQQLILTTHNAWWLDLVPPESIRVITRDKSGAHVHTPPKERIRQLLEEQDLYPSEIMGTYGPEGLLYVAKPES
jgi:hypothetical protein